MAGGLIDSSCFRCRPRCVSEPAFSLSVVPAASEIPVKNLEEEGLPKNPDLRIAQLRFLLSLPENRKEATVHKEPMAALRQTLDWQMDMDLLNRMKKANEEELKGLDEELEDEEKNLGESEIWDAMMAKPKYLCRIGDKVSRAGRPLC
ncbi:26S proteasome non-ATPase regulatory subunit 6 [Sciurus carolinensis]|uniref:26S proteasome non-ATPase regulatory subunit 6 n=1 Tax=Sciurus carolinensis TaxID=30640 RepID=A0AA41N5E0_SCICA|nr:26S proteasome non-ATPase regulatory subunit 6 [Sciurus carolinensis]